MLNTHQCSCLCPLSIAVNDDKVFRHRLEFHANLNEDRPDVDCESDLKILNKVKKHNQVMTLLHESNYLRFHCVKPHNLADKSLQTKLERTVAMK